MTTKQNNKNATRLLARLTERVTEAWRAWKNRRQWTAEHQLEHLRNMMQRDQQWFAHDKIAKAFTTRYLAALAPNWMHVDHDEPGDFRRELGLGPSCRTTSSNQESLK